MKTMNRKEMLQKFGEIKALVANMVITYDMCIQFDVMTAKGVCTNLGNVGNWPFMPKVGPIIQICCEQYTDSLFAIMSECLQIQTNADKSKWQVTARFNKVYSLNEIKLLINRKPS